MDVLSDIIRTLRMRNRMSGRVELTAPWGMRVGPDAKACFHVIIEGDGWLDMEGLDEPIPLGGGDFILLPGGHEHQLRSSLEAPVVPLAELLARCEQRETGLHYGGGGIATSVVCGEFMMESQGRNPLMDCLPPLILVRADAGPVFERLHATLQLIATEASSPLPGAETVIDRLGDVLFVQAIRAHIASGLSPLLGLPRGLADPQVGEALRLIHNSPQEPWSVQSLAEAVAMSRSAFAARFSELVGESPFQYLTAWRMQKASRRLLDGDPIAEVARAVGYEGYGAFVKAFKKHLGATPGEFRQQATGARLDAGPTGA